VLAGTKAATLLLADPAARTSRASAAVVEDAAGTKATPELTSVRLIVATAKTSAPKRGQRVRLVLRSMAVTARDCQSGFRAGLQTRYAASSGRACTALAGLRRILPAGLGKATRTPRSHQRRRVISNGMGGMALAVRPHT
jgi:hypothetical protein